MTISGPFRAAAAALAALACIAAAPLQRVIDARPSEVRLLVSNGIRVPFEAVRAQAETAVGRRLVVEYGASRRLQETIEAGQPFELTILTKEVVDEMVAKGKVAPGGRLDLARVPVGVALRGNRPAAQDIGTPDGLKTALLGAKAIHFTGAGASRPTIDKTLAGLGIGAALKERLDGSGSTLEAPAPSFGPGEYELLLTLASEITPTPGWTYLGAIPAQFQVPVVMTAGVGAGGDAQAARTLIAFLGGPAMEPALKASRMTR